MVGCRFLAADIGDEFQVSSAMAGPDCSLILGAENWTGLQGESTTIAHGKKKPCTITCILRVNMPGWWWGISHQLLANVWAEMLIASYKWRGSPCCMRPLNCGTSSLHEMTVDGSQCRQEQSMYMLVPTQEVIMSPFFWLPNRTPQYHILYTLIQNHVKPARRFQLHSQTKFTMLWKYPLTLEMSQ